MSNKRIGVFLSVGAAVIFLVGIFFILIGKGCVDELSFYCTYEFGEGVIQPLIYWSGSIFLVGILMCILNLGDTQLLRRVNIGLVPLLVLWLVVTPVTCSAPLSFCLDKEKVSWLSAGIFLLANLVLIIYSKYKKVS